MLRRDSILKYRYLASALVFGLVAVQPVKAETEMAQRAALMASTQQDFFANDFDRLESVSNTFRTERSRTASGNWYLGLFYAGIHEALKTQIKAMDREAAFERNEETTRKWAEKYPDSPAAHIAYSLALTRRAWTYRGGGYASTVSQESWAQFKKYIALARENLETFKAVASVDPGWYDAMLEIARDQSWDRSEYDALWNEALEREPLFYPNYFAVVDYLLPKWHGDIRQIEDFAQEAARRTRQQEGQAMYARIYWYASQTEFKNDIFNNSLADWAQMKEGFEDVISRYPEPWNLNNYARFACLAGDKPKTVELLKRIESSLVAEAWIPISLKEQCTTWALQP